MAEQITQVLGIVGIKHCGAYDATVQYEKLNVVTYQGSSYCAKGNTLGNLPTNTAYWDLMAEKGDKGDEGDKGETGNNGYTPVKGTDYFTAADIAELEQTLSSDVTDEVSDQLSTLTSATPLVADSTTNMTDTTRVYVNTTDGHWYWYDGDSWEDGGVYQASSDTDAVKKLNTFNYQKNDFTGVTNLDTTFTYNFSRGKQYKIIVTNTAITYSNTTSFCLQYYDTVQTDNVDIFRKKGNVASGTEEYYLNLLNLDATTVRFVVHTNTSANISIEIMEMDCFYANNSRTTGTDYFVNHPVKKDKEYLFKIQFKNYDQNAVKSQLTNNSVIGIKGTNDPTDSNGEFFLRIRKKEDVEMPQDTYYIKFTPSNDYDYLNIYGKLKSTNYLLYEIYDITDTNESDLYFSSIDKIDNDRDNDFEALEDDTKLKINFDDYTPFDYGNILSNGLFQDLKYSLTTSNFLQFKKGIVKIVFDPELYHVKLCIYDSTKTFVQRLYDDVIEFEANPLYYYKICFDIVDSTDTITFNSPIDEGYISLYYVSKNKSKTDLKLYHQRLFNTLNSVNTPHLYAHRGYQAEAPENSIPAFRLAGEYKFWGIETDLWATSDDVIVCMHDSSINRMTDGTGTISSMTYAQIQQYHIDTGTNVEQYSDDELVIPTIDDYLKICRYYNLVPFIELKEDIVAAVIQKLKDYGMENIAVISSFDWNLVVKARKLSNVFVHWINTSSTEMTHVEDLSVMGNAGRSFNYTDMTQVPSTLNSTLNGLGVDYCFRAADTVEMVKKQIELGLSYIPTNAIKPSQLL